MICSIEKALIACLPNILVRAEHKVLTISNNPFVVKLFYAFQSKDYLYLVMEYLIGGDLSAL